VERTGQLLLIEVVDFRAAIQIRGLQYLLNNLLVLETLEEPIPWCQKIL
jgi:hypothetical protein